MNACLPPLQTLLEMQDEPSVYFLCICGLSPELQAVAPAAHGTQIQIYILQPGIAVGKMEKEGKSKVHIC